MSYFSIQVVHGIVGSPASSRNGGHERPGLVIVSERKTQLVGKSVESNVGRRHVVFVGYNTKVYFQIPYRKHS